MSDYFVEIIVVMISPAIEWVSDQVSPGSIVLLHKERVIVIILSTSHIDDKSSDESKANEIGIARAILRLSDSEHSIAVEIVLNFHCRRCVT